MTGLGHGAEDGITQRTDRAIAGSRIARRTTRFVKRLTDAPAEAVERAPADGGWSAAQIGWHVAAVDASFAGLVSGENPAREAAARTASRRGPGPRSSRPCPEKIEAGKRVQPPAEVRRDEVLAALADSAAKLDAALAGLDAERGAGYAITHPAHRDDHAAPVRRVGDRPHHPPQRPGEARPGS